MRAGLVIRAALLVAGLAPAPTVACDLALVLAMDVSLSVDTDEYALQMHGTALALEDPAVQAAILSGAGGVSLSGMHWSGRHRQHVFLPWTYVQTKADLNAVAQRLRLAPRLFQSDTAPGSAIDFAKDYHAINGVKCARRVIDVSGDGIENTGLRTRTASATAISDGITINGLVILGEDDRLEDFYRHNVIGGPGAFLEIANGYGDYPRAIRDKLLKELPQMVAKGPKQ